MAKTTNQSILRGIEGKMGDVVMRTVNGKTIVSKAPKRRSKKSAREAENHSLFKQAAAFAVECMRDPGLKQYFKDIAKKRKLPNGYTAALSLKLKELNAAAREELRKATALDQEHVKVSACIDHTNGFVRQCRDTEDIVGDAIYSLSTALGNIERSALGGKEKEVLASIAYGRIRRWLDSRSHY